MTVYYVGAGGNNSNAGTSWALRKLTLNGAEDIPVAAGDTVYVGPGVYREALTCAVSGSSGSPITYVADVTGENTDGVGGVVRVTGSDNDTTGARQCLVASSKNYRTFRGFVMDFSAGGTAIVGLTSCTNWIIEDCTFQHDSNHIITIAGASSNSITIRRCVFRSGWGASCINITHTATVDNANILIENCLLLGSDGVAVARVGGITVKNCAFLNFRVFAVAYTTLPAAGQTVTVNNCVIAHGNAGLTAPAGGTGYIVEDYNAIYNCLAARSNTNTGANSTAYPPLWALPMLHAGQVLPAPPFGALSEWSQVKRIAGTSEATDDLFGRTRPATSSKKSWGAVQYNGIARETTTIDGGSGASLKLADAGRVAWRVPVTAVSTTISVKVYREADYAGTAPQMVIKQPGQADRTTTDAGSAATWNTLTDTFTPAASPPYVVVEVVSSNTATSGNYDTFADTLSVS